ASVVGHARDGTRQELERRLALLPRLDGGAVGGAGRKVRGDRGQVVDVHEARGHGDDDLGRARGQRVHLAGQLDGQHLGRARRGDVVEVEGGVPGAGDDELVVGAVRDTAGTLRV